MSIKQKEQIKINQTSLVDLIYNWSKQNLFSSRLNTILTLIAVSIILFTVPSLFSWSIWNATWIPDSNVCLENDYGACWGFINARFRFLIFGVYPFDEHWRPALSMFLLLSLIIISCTPFFWKPSLILIWLAGIIVSAILMWGGVFGLPYVNVDSWSGFPLTLILSIVGCALGFPIGIFLALGRRSDMPIISGFCVIFIEFIRGVPLISVLFMSTIMLPLFLPEGVTVNSLLRIVIGISIFTGAYLAEVFRGGLQSIHKGQFEASTALGLNYWQSMRIIILPQALRIVIPVVVGSFISVFKDTSLVSILGLFDFLGTVRSALKDLEWRNFHIEGLLFTAMVYFIFCYAMYKYSIYLEKLLNTHNKA